MYRARTHTITKFMHENLYVSLHSGGSVHVHDYGYQITHLAKRESAQ